MNNLLITLLCLVLHTSCISNTDSSTFITPDNPAIEYIGRVDFSNPLKPKYAYSGVTIRTFFEGPSCYIQINNLSEGEDDYQNLHTNYYNIFIDGKLSVIKLKNGKNIIKVAEGLSDGKHSLEIFKRTEALCGVDVFEGLILEKGKGLLKNNILKKRKIEFIGNSITCGYGNEGDNKDCHFSAATENNYMAYGAITSRMLKAEYMSVCYSGRGVIQNYDKTANGTLPEIYPYIIPTESREYNFSFNPDVVVINLGTNDFAHSNPDSAEFVSAYINFLNLVRKKNPKATIFAITGPMINDSWPTGNKAKSACKNYIKSALKTSGHTDAYFFEMSSQGELGYGCDWHPGIMQHEKNAIELSSFIKEKMSW